MVERATGNASASGDGPQHYVHGTAPEEQRRLSRLNDLINRRSLAELQPKPGERILDVGCGLGQLTRALARVVGGSGRVLGVDESQDQLAEASRLAREAGEGETPELRRGDAANLPLAADEWGSFDVVHTRFVLEHVRDPLAVVRAMAGAVRPGGRIVLEDDDHDLFRLWPELPIVSRVWRAYLRTYENLGNDPYVGRKLVELLQQAGARPVRNQWLFFGSCAGHSDFEAYVTNLSEVFRGAEPAIAGTGLVAGSDIEEARKALSQWSRRPDAAFWYATAWAEGRRPETGEETGERT